MSSWNFSLSQYESIKKLISGEIKVDVVNRQKITEMVKEKETIYVSHVLGIFQLYEPILVKFDGGDSGFQIQKNCKLSFLIFYLQKMMIRSCQIKSVEVNHINNVLLAPWISKIVKNVLSLEDIIFQEIFLNEFLICFENQNVNPQIWFMFLFEILKNFDFEQIRNKIWNVLFDTIIQYVSDLLNQKKIVNSIAKQNIQIFAGQTEEIIPQINQFRPFNIRDNLASPLNSPEKPKEKESDQEKKPESQKPVKPISPFKFSSKNAYFESFGQGDKLFKLFGSETLYERTFDLIFSIAVGKYKVTFF